MIRFRLTMNKDDKNDDVRSRYLYVSLSIRRALAQSIFLGFKDTPGEASTRMSSQGVR